MQSNLKPAVLIVLDGFGIAPPSETNAVYMAKTPFYDSLINNYPTTLLDAAGLSVGLPFGEVGNSEVGHYNIGSGRLLYQSLPRINISIEDGSFFDIELLHKAAKRVKEGNGNLHILGMIGTGGVHSHQKHLVALLKFCKLYNIPSDKVFLHAFLDGRDSAKDVGLNFIKKTLKSLDGVGRLATISGRFYAMDRNSKWSRTEKTYNAMVKGESTRLATDALKTIEDSYNEKVYDEEFIPTVMVDENNKPISTIKNDDTLLFFNFRADRARQITDCFVQKEIKGFERGLRLDNLAIITFTEYKKGLPVNIIFPPQIVDNPLAKILSDKGLKQYHIAETEKYAHVTFFFNGLIEKPFEGEDREIVPSPAVITYDQQPEMSANEVTDKLVDAIKSDKYNFLLVNYANGDMVGHTGNMEASIKAIETLDICLSRIIPAVLKQNGSVFITADHGNVEEVYNYQTFSTDKEHSIYPVPFIIINNKLKGKVLLKPKSNDISMYEPTGILADVAPTILSMMGIEKPPSMKGGLKI